MPNIPFTKEKVKALDKGFHLTREVLSFDKSTGQFITYPNRKQRRDNIYRPLKGLNIDFIQPIYNRNYILVQTNKKGKVTEKKVTKEEYYKTDLPGRIEYTGIKSIIHYKN